MSSPVTRSLLQLLILAGGADPRGLFAVAPYAVHAITVGANR